MRLMHILPAILLLSISASTIVASTAVAAEPATASMPAPPWYLDDIAFMTRDGGRWIASNADYQNENEPFDSYGLEWKKGYANSMTGRLFAIRDGEETGDFWRFRQYWHPGKGKAIVEQFGLGGAFGAGAMWSEGDKRKMTQTFYGADGAASDQGHIVHNPDDNTHVTKSFNIIDGEWASQRVYSWTRVIKENEDAGGQ
jgi:hypothetical protein